MPNSQIFWWEKYLETHRNTLWLLSLKLSFQELSDWGLWMRIRVLIVMLLSMPQTALRYLRCSWPVAICEWLVNPWTKSLADSHFLSISHLSAISIWFIPCRFMQTWKRPLVSRIQLWIRFQKEKNTGNFSGQSLVVAFSTRIARSTGDGNKMHPATEFFPVALRLFRDKMVT